jgi:LmbE family N-acetylglucosaminyl deacetylase
MEHTVDGEKLSLLAVFARTEDEAFGPSGTLARYAGEGIRVSLVTAYRELVNMIAGHRSDPALVTLASAVLPRDTLCSCRAAGIHRICLDQASDELASRARVLEERLIRLIRQVQPQVIVTYGPEGLSGGSEQLLVNRLALQSFNLAGEATVYPEHAREGLYPYQPQKLYYSVLPKSLLARWGLSELNGVPDDRVTTVLDVSPYSEMKLKAVYCQRHHVMDYTRWLEMSRGLQWNQEHFVLAASNLGRKSRKENDLFAGLR